MQKINAATLIDKAPLNKHHKILVFWCFGVRLLCYLMVMIWSFMAQFCLI